MATGVLELFKIGIGPSSSHTVGPMVAAARFATELADAGLLDSTDQVRVELFGSLGATGAGHGSVPAVVLGLCGERPDLVDPAVVAPVMDRIGSTGVLRLLDRRPIRFDPSTDIVLRADTRDGFHPNAMAFTASDVGGTVVSRRTYYSVGGGFVLDEQEATAPPPPAVPLPYPFGSGAELLSITAATGLPISDIVLANESSWQDEDFVRSELLRIWRAMQQCVRDGCSAGPGVLPGGLNVRRRAPQLAAALPDLGASVDAVADPLAAMDHVTLWALAVNEQNAAGGRVVTAPTNGAAGIVPAVLHYYRVFVPGADDDGVVRFLLTAAAIGSVIKENASISGAEVGCQGEVGSACAMAAAGLTEVLGGTPQQVENAAEIGIEHNLGLTCDPVGGLVQIPCIERNAVAAVKAITAARIALRGDGQHRVSLDDAVRTMRETGADMADKYKETARGGLALNVVEC